MNKNNKNTEVNDIDKKLHISDVSTRFLCDVCGLEKHANRKHKMYDENWNEQDGLNMCNECFREGLGVS